MTKKTKVKICMDCSWSFWFQRDDAEHKMWPDELPTLEVDEQLVAEFERISGLYFDMKGKIEQLYRVQEGLKPFETPEIPKCMLIIDPYPKN
jgi:hypothetical protein